MKRLLLLFLAAACLVAPSNIACAAHHKPKPPAKVPQGQNVTVWVNTKTGIYHYEGERYYGKTKNGKYMTEKDAIAAGYRLGVLTGQYRHLIAYDPVLVRNDHAGATAAGYDAEGQFVNFNAQSSALTKPAGMSIGSGRHHRTSSLYSLFSWNVYSEGSSECA
jgi:hypothetical protein